MPRKIFYDFSCITREPDVCKMFVGFIFLLLVGLLRAGADAQCTSVLELNVVGDFVNIPLPSDCPVTNTTINRDINGTTVVYIPKYTGTTVSPGFRCLFYEGSSTSGTFLGAIPESLAGWVELPQNLTEGFIHCVGEATSAFLFQVTVPTSNVTSVAVVDKSLIKVESLNFPATYPANYIQETVIESSQSTTYAVTFNSTFGLNNIDALYITSDEGTGFGYSSTITAPDPFEITGKEIEIQFVSDIFNLQAGFQITFEKKQLTCSDQGQVKIRLLNHTVYDLCGNEDGYVIISSTPVEDVNSVDPECKANASDPNFNLGLYDCSILEITDDVLKAHFLLRCLPKLNKSEPIQRYMDGCFNLTCEYNRTELLETGAIVPEIKKVELDSVEQEGRLGVSITFTTDQSYSFELDGGAEVTVPEPVYTKVELSTTDGAFYVQLKECWATPSENPDDVGTRYNIIENSCPANNPFESEDAIEIDRNYMEKNATFNFKSFVWSENAEGAIYVYCRVTICHEDVDSGCPAAPGCTKKRKREVSSPDSLLVSSGPIFIKNSRKKSCEQSNGGCSDVCEMRNDDVICLCYDGKFLGEDEKTCQGVEKYEIIDGGSDSWTLVGVIAAFFIVVGCLFAWSKKDGKSGDGSRHLI
ncbi:uncharacterized protein LOC143452866 [Clavelina lepadiformis]|uniref:uncharacterized protein LOC143452866 n=1 Tax=Clavelina lepadiformis TaxID=159417 RepID=UPI0040438304